MEISQQDGQAVTEAAEWALAQWTRRLGASGTAAMRVLPGLAAVVDQHAAQIRDAIGTIKPEVLAAYADGVADTVMARGWSPAEIEAGWERASWPSVHLLAVCVLFHGEVPPPPEL